MVVWQPLVEKSGDIWYSFAEHIHLPRAYLRQVELYAGVLIFEHSFPFWKLQESG